MQIKDQSIFDPCPYGYRVPTSNANTNGNSDFFGFTTPSTIEGISWLGYWWPTQGYRLNNNAKIFNVGDQGYYWSSTPSGTIMHAYVFNFTKNINMPTVTSSRGSGFPVRCVQEERKKQYYHNVKTNLTKV